MRDLDELNKASEENGFNHASLPGGVSLAHALNCVRIVENIRSVKRSETRMASSGSLDLDKAVKDLLGALGIEALDLKEQTM